MDVESQLDFLPTASLETLRARAELVNQIHAFFQMRDFIHVETPLVSRDTVVDRHIDPVAIPRSSFGTRSASPGEENPSGKEAMFLQTSPEFAMKRLIAGGARAIYQICKAFRQGESGNRHNPEFTMLEWYRTGDSYQQGIDLLADFAEAVLGHGRPQVITWRDAFIQHAGIDPLDATIEQLARTCREHNVPLVTEASATKDELLDVLMSEVIEANVSAEAPHIVIDWPTDQAALAKVRTNDDGTRVAERFELFAGGLELANGYHELLDAEELQRRNAIVNQQRTADAKPSLPSDSRLLDAMKSGLPSCSGVAVGVDRLAMVVLGKQSINEVIAFPFERA